MLNPTQRQTLWIVIPIAIAIALKLWWPDLKRSWTNRKDPPFRGPMGYQ